MGEIRTSGSMSGVGNGTTSASQPRPSPTLLQRHDEQIAKHDEQIGALTDLIGRLAQAEIRLVERMEKMGSSLGERMEKSESSQQEMRAAMTQLFERMDRFIQGLEGDGHKRK